MRYLFGDSDLAAHRLEVLHEVFSETSRPLLQEAASQPISLAIDLGCGPGVCTHFLAETVGCDRAVGLDSSSRFIALAQARATERVQFRVHDVTVVPFPVGSADLLYGRYLLTHLHEPATRLARWASVLRPGGRIVVEDAELIHTDQPTLRAYLELVAALLAHQGHQLYLGPTLDKLPTPDGLRREVSRVARLPVATAQAARMFWMNLPAWKADPFVTYRYGEGRIASLDHQLRALIDADQERSDIEWGIRQLVYRGT